MKTFICRFPLVGLVLALAVVLACASDRGGEGSSGGWQTGATTGAGTTGTTTTNTVDPTNPRFDIGGGATAGGQTTGDPGGCLEEPPPTDATLRGTVFTPNLQIPISGALVYTASTRPEGVPDNVYCAECQDVQCAHEWVLTNADGSFELPARSGTGQWFAVTKGEFLHITQMDIAAGDTMLDPVVSSLPGEWNPAEGHYIPRMAVTASEWDRIFNVLAKIGLAEVDALGNLVPGTEQFDIYGDMNDDRTGLPNLAGQNLLDNVAEMNKYHIIFISCISEQPLAPTNVEGEPLSAARIENIREWVAAGGKWYVTDWANEYLADPFPDYQTFHNGPAAPYPGQPGDLEPPGSPLLGYDSNGTVLDPDMLAWLQALPAALKDIGNGLPTLLNLPQVLTQGSFSALDATPQIIVQDADGMDVNVGHYPWVTGPCSICTPTDVRPMTVTGRYGCGRMLFSTYHTNEVPHTGLTPQELILLYIILEIGVCNDKTPPPPPPQG